MAAEMRMPALGQTSVDLKILEWLKREGDSVRLGDEILRVETDKADLTVDSFLEGTVLKIVAPAGSTVSAGDVIAYLGYPGEPVPLERSTDVEAIVRSPVWQPASNQPTRSTEPLPMGKVLASPAARAAAKANQIDLSTIAGSGPEGRIEVRDVRAAVEGAKQ